MLAGTTDSGLEKVARWKLHPSGKTPMMQQFFAAKEQHPDAIVFFRMGDFYETFFDDAVEAARVLELTLTSRNKKDPEPIPMAGVPHHAAPGYVRRLLEAGFKVAVCEQVEDPKHAKGIVKREVVQVVTPGLVLDAAVLDGSTNRFLAGVVGGEDPRAPHFVAWVDATTGEVKGSSLASMGAVADELARLEPAEIVVWDTPNRAALVTGLGRHLDAVPFSVVPLPKPSAESATGALSLEGAAALVHHYIASTQKARRLPLRPLETVDAADRMGLSAATVKNLELCRTLADRAKVGSLLHLLDRTRTAMGSRLLKQWMLNPLVDVAAVNERLDAVEGFCQDVILRGQVRDALAGVYDLERLLTRVVARTANPRDLVALAGSLERLPGLASLLAGADLKPGVFERLAQGLDAVVEASVVIRAGLVEEPPITLKDGGVIREGFDADLDDLIGIARDGKAWFNAYVESLKAETGISSLKIRYNSVFGYFIEVTKANLHLVPETWIRKQTLANAERYYTADLKEREEKVLGADERRLALETALFEQIRDQVGGFAERIQATATAVAAIDVLASLGDLANLRNYCRPTVDDSGCLTVVGGRHAVIEALLPKGEFVPNDVHLDIDEQQLVIITGPNMAGKSTVMRQTALIALMAQMGSFVPATDAQVGIVDQIFTRVGASDNLAQGQSTFMVEMTEASHILASATRRSLIIIDEIGRGTSTYDGVSIAWSIAEHLHDTVAARTLFATHYHELTELAQTRQRVVNMHIAVKEWQQEIVFLRRLEPGGTNRSYGIQVGRLAGLPEDVVSRAKEVLRNLEGQQLDPDSRPRISRGSEPPPSDGAQDPWQLSFFAPAQTGTTEVAQRLAELTLDDMTPRAALEELYALRALIEQS